MDSNRIDRFYVIPGSDWETPEHAERWEVIDRNTNCPVTFADGIPYNDMHRNEAQAVALILNRLHSMQIRYEAL